jgi:3-isopropylmalate/(R)-2-methylmalate dehydratase large subunit
MGMTITEKILAAHAGQKAVQPGELVDCTLDMVMANDITAPIAIKEFEKVGATEMFDPDRVTFVLSHFVPTKDIRSAEQCSIVRDFARKHRMKYFYDEGRGGIEHILLPQEGLALPGDIVLGADSHSCTYGGLGCFSTGVGSTDLAAALITGTTWFKVPETMRFHFHGKPKPWVSAKDMILHVIGTIGVAGATYRAMEFTGEAVRALSVDARLTLCNMAIEAGGKSGIVPPDEVTLAYVNPRAKRKWVFHESDKDATYHSTYDIDMGTLDLQVACPYSPDNVKPLDEVGGVDVDQVFIGSCTNARLEDLRAAARVAKGHHVNAKVRAMVVPGSQTVKHAAEQEGLDKIFQEAGFEWRESGCSMCLGMNPDILQPGERCASTSNRNFEGRQGRGGRTHLVSPMMAAAAAIEGHFTDIRNWHFN